MLQVRTTYEVVAIYCLYVGREKGLSGKSNMDLEPITAEVTSSASVYIHIHRLYAIGLYLNEPPGWEYNVSAGMHAVRNTEKKYIINMDKREYAYLTSDHRL